MLQFLDKPYPFNDDLGHNAKVVFFLSLGVLAFLLVYQPINIDPFSTKEFFYLATGLTLSNFFILTVNLIVLPSLFKNFFNTKTWDIKREIIWNIWMLLAVSSSDFFFYTLLFGIMDITFTDIVKILLLGFIPVAGLIVINHEWLLRSHLRSAQQLNKKLIESKQNKETLVHFESDYKSDDLVISPSSLVMVKSADNYIEVYFVNEGKVKKQMIRSSLTKAENTLKEYEYIFKCHRSYIVNINYIKEIQGNSQGYMLYFDKIDFPALVSQRYIEEFKKLI